MGIGVKLNEKFSKTFSPDFYVGYGFKDHRWKYGIGLDTKLTSKRTSVFRVHYSDDIFAAGRINKTFWDSSMKFNEFNLDIYNDHFYRNQQFGASFLYDVSNSLSAKLALTREKQNALFDYQYQNFANDFQNFSTTLSLKYAPKDKNLMTPSGKLTYQKGYPQFYVNFEKGFELLGGKLDYHRLDAFAIHQFKSKMGTSQIKISGGISSGSAPIWKNFEIVGDLNAFSTSLFSKINTPSTFSFVTMPSGSFYVDQFAALHFSQELPFQFKTFGNRVSTIKLAYHSVIGGFKNPENHQFDFKVLDHPYQEVGAVWNRFLGRGFDVGFFYRLGYYQTSNFNDNYGIQIKLSGF